MTTSRSHYRSSTSQYLRPPSIFVPKEQTYDTLRPDSAYETPYRAPSPQGRSLPRSPQGWSVPRSLRRTSNVSKSYSNLETIDKEANADPELRGVRRAKNGYTLSVDLKAHLLRGLQNASTQNQTQIQRQNQTLQRTSVYDTRHKQQRLSHVEAASHQRHGGTFDVGDTRRQEEMVTLRGGSRVSMLNLNNIETVPMPPPIVNRPKTRSSHQKAVVTLEGAKNRHFPSSQSNQIGDGFIMKSWRASEAKKEEERQVRREADKENIEFDLCLFGTVDKKVTKTSKKVKNTPTIVVKQDVTKEKVKERRVESSSSVVAPNFNIRPPSVAKKTGFTEETIRSEKISTGILTNLNNTKYELEEEEMVLLDRLTRGAPPGSFQKQVDVERETEEIFGPLPREEVEKLYAKEMINVDVISEVVHLELKNGQANVQLKLTFNKIVPVEDSEDTFKMTKVVVTKNITVDLTATEERRQVWKEVQGVQRNGVLDKEYTWMLYRIFSTLADRGDSFGVNGGRTTVAKEVGEERVFDLNRQMSSARGDTNKKFQILEKTFLTPEERSDFSTVDRNAWSRSEQRPSFVESRSYNDQTYNNSGIGNSGFTNGNYANVGFANEGFTNGGFTSGGFANGGITNNGFSKSGFSNSRYSQHDSLEPKDFFSESATTSHRIEEASHNLSAPRDSSWKREFSRWLPSEAERSGSRLGRRIDVYNYLRPGGSRNYDYLTTEEPRVSRRDESVSERVYESNGGGHRERMRSYDRGGRSSRNEVY